MGYGEFTQFKRLRSVFRKRGSKADSVYKKLKEAMKKKDSGESSNSSSSDSKDSKKDDDDKKEKSKKKKKKKWATGS